MHSVSAGKKIFLALVLLPFCLLLVGANGLAAPMRVIYGFDREFPPFSYEEPGGKETGFDVELIKAIFNGADVTLVPRPLKWDLIPLELSSGAVTITPGMVKNPQRDRLFLFSDKSLFSLPIRLFTKVYKRYPGLSMFRGQAVAVEKGSFQHRQLEAFGGINIKTYDNRADGLQALYYDEVAAFCGPMPNTYYYINKLQYGAITTVGSPLAIVPLRIAVNRSRGDVLRLVNEGLARVIATGEYDRLYRKWFVREITAEEQDILVKSAVQGAIPSYAPYSGQGQGAAVLTATGKVLVGCVVENAEGSLNISALRSAAMRAIGEGEYEITAAVLVDNQGKIAAPSPEDLQTLYEFSPGILVIQVDEKGKAYTLMVSELYKTPVTQEVALPSN